jgi:LemA protein
MTILIVIVVLIALVAFYAIGIYNQLVKLKNLVAEAWSGIDVQLKKRYDLIPNLVETVKGYATHEKETFENVTRAAPRRSKPPRWKANKWRRTH